jgi:hypothetical protein
MLVKIALVLFIFWLVGLFIPNSISYIIHIIPLVSVAMILISGNRRMLNNPNEY